MDGAITRAEHEAFSDFMQAENKRIEEENNRQNKRLELLESNMQQIISQQLTTLTATIERLNLSVNNILKEQSEISERLKKLENRDGDMWRTVIKYAITAIVGGVLTFILTRIGI
ncbi:MAG: hypothetical protein OSJ72_10495 [Lachnospiraceae bacterium]|jgi:chromosome segregation ATPase|nr:hypothetical protein [Lachnospiraceae bacterium]